MTITLDRLGKSKDVTCFHIRKRERFGDERPNANANNQSSLTDAISQAFKRYSTEYSSSHPTWHNRLFIDRRIRAISDCITSK